MKIKIIWKLLGRLLLFNGLNCHINIYSTLVNLNLFTFYLMNKKKIKKCFANYLKHAFSNCKSWDKKQEWTKWPRYVLIWNMRGGVIIMPPQKHARSTKWTIIVLITLLNTRGIRKKQWRIEDKVSKWC